MDINEFKKSNQPIYVYVEGKVCGLVVTRSKSMSLEKEYNTKMLQYCGYIEIPYSYDLFNSLSIKQQLAISKATMVKSGLCYKLNQCDINAFFEEG